MSNNIVNFNDYKQRNTKPQPDWNVTLEDSLANMSSEKLMKLYNDIMNDDSIEGQIQDAGLDFTRFVIGKVYELGADAEDKTLSDDMIFITMLFSAALEEYFTGNYENSNGDDNPMYRFLLEMKEGVVE